MGRMRYRLAALLAGAVFLMACSGVRLPYRPDLIDTPGTVRTSVIMDGDRNKIFDNLDRLLLETDEKELLPVLVLLEEPVPLSELERVAGPLDLVYQFQIVPGLAVRATADQIRALARFSLVRQVEWDGPVSIQLDGANRWFGSEKARQDFGVDGDRDGSPTRYTSSDIVVAVIDTGIDGRHVDLDGGKVIGWRDWVNNRSEPYDDHGHGTHVASIVAGTGEGNSLYKGVAPGAALVGLKVLDGNGTGSLSNVAAAVDWAVENKDRYGIRVISLSLGTSSSSDGTDTVSMAVNNAVDRGLVAVVAAGNSGPARYTIGSPGAAAKAITVGAMADPSEKGFHLASFSSRGPTRDNRIKPEIAAPGVSIMAARANSGSGYVSYSGTSMATPFVSGAVALMLDANPNLTPAAVANLLRDTAIDWGTPGQDVDYGHGRLDAYAAVKAAGGYWGIGPTVPGHLLFQGSLGARGAQAEHLITVTATDDPLAVTLIMPDWSGRSSPDFDLYVYDPSGAEFGRAAGTSRQETVTGAITRVGTYRIVVKSYAGTGPYVVDVSGAVAGGGGDAPPSVSVEAPVEGAVVSGSVAVTVRATDDKAVTKVEVAVGDGTWQDITRSYDGALYRYTWNTTLTADGNQVIRARATDSAGQTETATRNVTVRNDSAGRVHAKVMEGRVSPATPDAWHEVTVHSVGWVDLTLRWSALADLDFYVYAPDGAYIGRAYTIFNPEVLRIDTERWGTGTYRIKVNLYAGQASDYTLAAEGFQVDTFTGAVSPNAADWLLDRYVSYVGVGRVELSWPTRSDLDFYVHDPVGQLRARAYTLRNPEVADVRFDAGGYWRVRVNLYSGAATDFTLRMIVPEANLS